ncbi:hypothetical protein VP01_5565g1 [Puccinia sorghi]|uniref:Uncharacterized protein n=1 Tax=Puccinia sorghi TaxID=27349 RepID=A0A0L6UJ46_9BASI|nr:hypothetical protein VP01_5565g1 [Puccinia sorghi]
MAGKSLGDLQGLRQVLDLGTRVHLEGTRGLIIFGSGDLRSEVDAGEEINGSWVFQDYWEIGRGGFRVKSLPCNWMSIKHLLNPDEILDSVQQEHDLKNSKETINHKAPTTFQERDIQTHLAGNLHLDDNFDSESNKLSDFLKEYQQKIMTDFHLNG